MDKTLADILREGLREARAMYQSAFYQASHFSEQWQLLIMKEAYDIDWNEHKAAVEDEFAWRSRKMLSKLQIVRKGVL
jgi:hypothetical protein